MGVVRACTGPLELIVSSFSQFDQDGSGFLSIDQLRAVRCSFPLI
jgi:Ca2+-binding EF-hand superfamily protein